MQLLVIGFTVASLLLYFLRCAFVYGRRTRLMPLGECLTGFEGRDPESGVNNLQGRPRFHS